MTQQRLILKQYRFGNADSQVEEPPNCDPDPSVSSNPFCLVGNFGPSFHRIDACSPGSEEAPTLDPGACDSNGMSPGNIYNFIAQIGQSDVSTAYADDSVYTPVNSVAKFVDNKYYGWMGKDIWVFDAQDENEILSVGIPSGTSPSGTPGGSGNWIVSATPTVNFDARSAIGLYPMNIDGIPYLVTAAQHADAGTTWKSIKLNGNTNVWTSGDMPNAIQAQSPASLLGAVHTQVRYRNYVYWIGTGAGTPQIFMYNPENDTMPQVYIPTNLRFPMDLCTYNDKVYLLAKQINGSKCDIVVYEIIGTTASKVLTLETQAAPLASNYEGRNSLFVDNYYESSPKLYAINYMETQTSGVNGHGLWQIESQNGTLVNNGRLASNPNMPNGVDFSGGEEDDIWRVFTDSKRDSGNGGIPLWEFRSSGKRGATYQSHIFQGSGNSHPFWASVQVHFIFSYAHERGPDIGARTANYGEVSMDITGYDFDRASDGVIGVDFKIKPTFDPYPAGTPIAVRFLLDENGHSVNQIATLSSPSSGTLTSDNRILMTATSGVTFSVDWNFTSDGYSGGDRLNLVGHVSTTGVE